MDHSPGFDFDVVHTPDVILIRVYYRDSRNVLQPHAEVRLSAGADFPALYDSFRREYKWPTLEALETELSVRYKGAAAERSHLSESERTDRAAMELAEYFKTWLVLRGRGMVMSTGSE